MASQHRKPNRLKGYDYNQAGHYFITICVKNKTPYFGYIEKGEIKYSWYGSIVLRYWQQIPEHYQNIEFDEFVIMPNHIHGIIVIRSGDVGTEQCSVPTSTPHYGLLSKVVKSFKNAVTRQIRLQMEDSEFAWQRSFYDHIIRDEKSLNSIRVYIKNNPLRWELDQDNPENLYM